MLAKMTVEQTFLTAAADTLAEDLDRIDTCVARLPPDWLWARLGKRERGRQFAAAPRGKRAAVDSVRPRRRA